MKLNVPYYKQNNIDDCGFVASKMILEYFDIKIDLEDMKQKFKLEENRPLLSTEVLLLLNQFGLKSSLYTKYILLNKSAPSYYNKFLSESLKQIEKLQLDIFIDVDNVININFIRKCIMKNIPIIALLNLSKFNKNNHFTPVVGFDDDYIYIHDINEKYRQITNDNFMSNLDFTGSDLIISEEINT